MISKCSEIITDWLEKKGEINHKDFDLYYYASYSLIITVLPVGLALVVGWTMGTPINSLLVILPFVLIRKYSGGYHAKNTGVCMFLSATILCVFTWISSHVVWSKWFIAMVLASVLSLFIFSPIESINRELNDVEKRCYKKMTMCLLGVLLLLILALDRLSKPRIAVCISTGIILSASLQVPCVVQNAWKNYQK